MRRISRVNRSIDLLHITPARSQSPHVCLACRVQATSFSTSNSRARPAPTGARTAAWTEKITSRFGKTAKSPDLEELNGSEKQLDLSKEGEDGEQGMEEVSQERPYKESSTWDGLEVVGDMQGIKLPSRLGFEPFATKEMVQDSATLIAALHRAVVEVFTLKNGGQSYSTISDKPTSVLNKTQTVKIIPTESGATLEYGQEASAKDIVNELEVPSSLMSSEVVTKAEETEQREASEEDAIADSTLTESIVKEEKLTTRDIIRSFDKAWLEVPLQDLDTKFAIIKRVFQLTGVKFPDSEIHNANTVRFLLSKLLKKPKPDKLVTVLEQNPKIQKLANVSISARRATKTDKEIKLGRQKLINDELRRRGLPVGAVRDVTTKLQHKGYNPNPRHN